MQTSPRWRRAWEKTNSTVIRSVRRQGSNSWLAKNFCDVMVTLSDLTQNWHLLKNQSALSAPWTLDVAKCTLVSGREGSLSCCFSQSRRCLSFRPSWVLPSCFSSSVVFNEPGLGVGNDVCCSSGKKE